MSSAGAMIRRAQCAGTLCQSEKIGWGGRIRTFTIHINSVVSYRLDHAPAALWFAETPSKLGRLRPFESAEGFSKIHDRVGLHNSTGHKYIHLSSALRIYRYARFQTGSGGRWLCNHSFEKFERVVLSGADDFRTESKVSWLNCCIRESFVGNYRVNYDLGLHFPVRTRWTLVPLLLVALTAKVQT